jgi:predicted phosphodiesterase
MRIQILSDLHNEFSYYQIKVADDVDVLVIAGDVTVARNLGQLKALAQSISQPMMFVAGNHDYYGGDFDLVNDYLKKIAANSRSLHFLNNNSVSIENVRFIGCTLWSNFDLAPNPKEYAETIGSRISDFYEISKLSGNRIRKFTPEDCTQLNEESRAFLRNELSTPCDARIVVVTHFMPSPRSIHPRYQGNVLNPYFCCNCENLMGSQVTLWIHGHTHDSMNYTHNGTRVVANPRGYNDENRNFNNQLIIQL